MRLSSTVLLSLILTALGCYHTTIETGRPPSGEVVTRAWAPSFIAGLVPPATVETADKCPNGVSKVETQLSFLNQIVGIVTLGIFTPMDIRVQCASANTSMSSSSNRISVAPDASLEEKQAVLAEAATLSKATGQPVFVKF